MTGESSNGSILDLILETLMPFSILVDSDKCVLKVGRSVHRMIKNKNVIGAQVDEFFENASKMFVKSQSSQTHPIGEIKIKNSPAIFRYQTLDLDSKSQLICLSPMFNDPQNIMQSGLKFADFSFLDPVIDFVMVYQAMRITEADLKERNESLKIKNRNLSILSAISNLCARATDQSSLLTRFVTKITEEFGPGACLQRDKNEFTRIFEAEGEAPLKIEIKPQDRARWVKMFGGARAERSDVQVEVFEFESDKNKVYEMCCLIPSRVGEAHDQLFILRSESPFDFGADTFELFREAGTFVGQALDQIEMARLAEENRTQLIANSKMATLGEMAGGLAHEINNPLTVLVAKAAKIEGLLARESFDVNVLKEDIAKIQKMSQRITKIIQGLRFFSRNATADPFEPAPLSRIVSDTLELCNEKLKLSRSEERRVGKECRSRWSPYH